MTARNKKSSRTVTRSAKARRTVSESFLQGMKDFGVDREVITRVERGNKEMKVRRRSSARVA